MECKKGRPIEVVRTRNSNYTLCAIQEGNPEMFCFISKEMRRTCEEAELVALNNQRHPELIMCNKNGSCFI